MPIATPERTVIVRQRRFDDVKVPKADLWYSIDWSEWLNGDDIASSNWIVPSDLTKTNENIDSGTKASVKISGGKVGETYTVINRIVTVTGQETDERSFKIQIVELKEG